MAMPILRCRGSLEASNPHTNFNISGWDGASGWTPFGHPAVRIWGLGFYGPGPRALEFRKFGFEV